MSTERSGHGARALNLPPDSRSTWRPTGANRTRLSLAAVPRRDKAIPDARIVHATDRLWLKTAVCRRSGERPESARPSPSPRDRRRSAIHTRSSHSTYAGGLSVMGSGAEYSAAGGARQLYPHLRKKLGATCTAAKCQYPTFTGPPPNRDSRPKRSLLVVEQILGNRLELGHFLKALRF
jgi:hypothetical protein